MVDTKSKWEDELGRWLKPFLDRLGHKARRRMCPLYISGLIGPGDRKSVQQMAARLAPGEYDQLHHFIADGLWDAAPLEAELLVQADRLVGRKDAVLVIDDTAMPKKGDRSVGVAPQYASSLGKTANCQTLVSLTLARGEVPVMVALRLFVPESWTSNPVRLKRAGVPVEHRAARTKPEVALAEIDRVIASGVRFGCVLADSGYGSSGPFRQALSERGLLWAVGLSRRQNVYPADIALIFPIAKTGKPRKYHVPDQPPVSAEALLAEGKWQRVSWRRGTKGRLTCLFTARRVCVADGHKHRMLDNRVQCMPGDEVWLVGERRATGEQKYYVSNLPADAQQDLAAAEAQHAADLSAERLPSIHDDEPPGTTGTAPATPAAPGTPATPPVVVVPHPLPTVHPDRYSSGSTPPASELKPGAPLTSSGTASPSSPPANSQPKQPAPKQPPAQTPPQP